MSEYDNAAGVSPFDAIRHTTDVGGEYWSARELAPLLGYSTWQKFSAVIDKARTACEQSGYTAADHFNLTVKLIEAGKGARRSIPDVHLSRYACYLIVQNGDPSKPVIAAGQTYFAEQTRRQELAQEEAQELASAGDTLAGLTDTQRRLAIRRELAERNKELATTAQGAGVLTRRDFAVFQDHGYRGLYAGETAQDIAARKGLPSGAAILDWMGPTELAANLFRSTQTEEKIRRDGISTRDAANTAHHAVGKAVRRFIIEELGGTPPEQLPTPSESIRQIEARERRRIEEEEERQRQPSLFPELDTRGEEEGEE